VTVREDGSVVVTLPVHAPVRLADALVSEKSAWIARHVARIAARQEAVRVRPPLGAGRMVTMHGIPHAIVLCAGPLATRSRRIRRLVDPPTILVTASSAAGQPLERSLERWLRAEARTVLVASVDRHAPLLGVTPRRITVRDQATRWGSASRSGTLSLNWRLVMAPPHVLDYVVVHELAHLADFSHSPAFWQAVRRAIPWTDDARRWLRAHGWELRAALD